MNRAGCSVAHHVFASWRRYASSSVPSKVFADAGSAEFLAAAATNVSIPNLHGLPEVSASRYLKIFLSLYPSLGDCHG